MSSNISKVFLTSYFLPALEKWRSQDWSSKLLFFIFWFSQSRDSWGTVFPSSVLTLCHPPLFFPLYLPPFLPSTVSLRQESPYTSPGCLKLKILLPQPLRADITEVCHHASLQIFFLNKRLFFWLSSQNNADLFIARQCQLNECIPTSSESTNCSEHFWHLKSSQELSTSVLVYLKLLRMYSHSLLPQSVPPTTSRSVLFEMHKTIIWALDNPSFDNRFHSN